MRKACKFVREYTLVTFRKHSFGTYHSVMHESVASSQELINICLTKFQRKISAYKL